MSIQCVAWVLEESDAEYADRLVLLSLANHADKHGRGAYPAQATIASEARLSDRTVRRALADLEASGRISRSPTRGPRGVVIWELQMDPDRLSARTSAPADPAICDPAPDIDAREHGRRCPTNRQDPSPKPSGEPPRASTEGSAASVSPVEPTAALPQLPERIERACDALAAAGMAIHDRSTVARLGAQHPDVDIEAAAARCAAWGRTKRIRHPLNALRKIVASEDAPRRGAGAGSGTRTAAERAAPMTEYAKAKARTERLMAEEAGR